MRRDGGRVRGRQSHAGRRAGHVHRVWADPSAVFRLWLDELQREVLAFPNGKHGDQVDSMVQFMIWAFDDVYNTPRIREL